MFCRLLENACKKLLSDAELLLDPPNTLSRLLKLFCKSLTAELLELDEDELLLDDNLLIKLCKSAWILGPLPDALLIPLVPLPSLSPSLSVPDVWLLLPLCECRASIRLCMNEARAWPTSFVDEAEDDESVADEAPLVEVEELEFELPPKPIWDKADVTASIMPDGGGPGGGEGMLLILLLPLEPLFCELFSWLSWENQLLPDMLLIDIFFS